MELEEFLLYLLKENQKLRRELRGMKEKEIQLKHLQSQRFNAAAKGEYYV